MRIISGLSDGAVLQRVPDGNCAVTVYLDVSGKPRASLGTLTAEGGERYLLSGIPAGGPYALTLSDDAGECKLHVFVGDVWILAGQSNMEGAGRMHEKEEALEEATPSAVRCYYEDNRFDVCSLINHEPWLSCDSCVRDVWVADHLRSAWKSDLPPYLSHGVPRSGIGPGHGFAMEMYRLTGVPQAIVSCALGGSSLSDWTPTGIDGENLYAAMLRRFVRTGSNVRGVFWDQGEAETTPDAIAAFPSRMTKLVEAIRNDLGAPELPVVEVQIAKCAIPAICADPSAWETIREYQRTLSEKIPYLDTVSAIDAEFDDLIHYSAPFQEEMGRRAARAMAALCGIAGGKPAPALGKIAIARDPYRPFLSVLEISFENVDALVSAGRPAGFSITDTPFPAVGNPDVGICHTELDGNAVRLYTELAPEALAEKYVHYGFGHAYYCNITDKDGTSIPGFGPLKISDCLSE